MTPLSTVNVFLKYDTVGDNGVKLLVGGGVLSYCRDSAQLVSKLQKQMTSMIVVLVQSFGS